MRIHVTGAAGSGTTTLGRALAEELSCPHFDSDDYYWLPTDPPYRTKRPTAERDALLLADLEDAPRCVESGSLVSWDPAIHALFDRVLYLWIPADVRLARLRDRELRELGAVDEEFIEWAARYDDAGPEQRSRVLHERWLVGLACPVLRLEGDLSTAERLARTHRWLASQ
jgi:adenylate kinase family enzyme